MNRWALFCRWRVLLASLLVVGLMIAADALEPIWGPCLLTRPSGTDAQPTLQAQAGPAASAVLAGAWTRIARRARRALRVANKRYTSAHGLSDGALSQAGEE